MLLVRYVMKGTILWFGKDLIVPLHQYVLDKYSGTERLKILLSHSATSF
jgi:hypothetical protein